MELTPEDLKEGFNALDFEKSGSVSKSLIDMLIYFFGAAFPDESSKKEPAKSAPVDEKITGNPFHPII